MNGDRPTGTRKGEDYVSRFSPARGAGIATPLSRSKLVTRCTSREAASDFISPQRNLLSPLMHSKRACWRDVFCSDLRHPAWQVELEWKGVPKNNGAPPRDKQQSAPTSPGAGGATARKSKGWGSRGLRRLGSRPDKDRWVSVRMELVYRHSIGLPRV